MAAALASEGTHRLMAIVATQWGGQIECNGEVIKALSWEQVHGISERFSALNPYDRAAVPGSILKIEDDNYDPKTGKQRQLHCVAISAKRYAPFVFDKDGRPDLLRQGINNKNDKWSQHGLGHLLNPTEPDRADRDWIAHVWENIICKTLDFAPKELPFANMPAVGRVTVSSPAVSRAFAKYNENKPYAEQIKPFNFLLSCHINPLGFPVNVSDPAHFHLIAPYQPDPRQWARMDWVDKYSGNVYRITTAGPHGSRNTARVKTYADVLREYEFHPESKCADADGQPCSKQTFGLLRRRHIRVEQLKYIGKESNSLEDVESGRQGVRVCRGSISHVCYCQYLVFTDTDPMA